MRIHLLALSSVRQTMDIPILIIGIHASRHVMLCSWKSAIKRQELPQSRTTFKSKCFSRSCAVKASLATLLRKQMRSACFARWKSRTRRQVTSCEVTTRFRVSWTCRLRKSVRPTKSSIRVKSLWTSLTSGKVRTFSRATFAHETKIAHTFQRVDGCGETLPGAAKELIARHVLSSSDAFISAGCGRIQAAKESVFRSFDLKPPYSVLTHDELVAACETNDVDASVVRNWVRESSTDAAEISIGEFLNVQVYPVACFPPTSASLPIAMERATYPSSIAGQEMTKKHCKEGAFNATVDWKFHAATLDNVLASDPVCVYVDGVLFEQSQVTTARPIASDNSRHHEWQKSSGGGTFWILNGVSDSRPVYGRNDDVQPTLVAQFVFDASDTTGTQYLASAHADLRSTLPAAKLTSHSNIIATECGNSAPGVSCLESTPNQVLWYEGDVFENGFAFSMWVDFSKQTAGDIVLADFESVGGRKFRLSSKRDQDGSHALVLDADGGIEPDDSMPKPRISSRRVHSEPHARRRAIRLFPRQWYRPARKRA